MTDAQATQIRTTLVALESATSALKLSPTGARLQAVAGSYAAAWVAHKRAVEAVAGT